LDARAGDSASSARIREPGLKEIECAFLGQAKAPIARAGQVVALQEKGARVVYLLCAHIEKNDWLVHRGSFVNGLLDENPFQEKHLVHKDIVGEAWDYTAGKRLKSSGQLNTLRAMAITPTDSWCELVAVASYRAEEMRAASQGELFDKEVAERGFEKNPFRWREGERWQSQARVSFLWSWVSADGSPRKVFEHPRLDKIMERTSIPVPSGMNENDTDLLRRLVAVAEIETKTTKAPCRYLGLEIASGFFEQDPSKWPADMLDDRKTLVNVAYEWTHVKTQGSISGGHRVTCRVNNLCGGRRVALNPLTRACPSGLTFTVDFFEAVAQTVRDGIKFRGIVFEGDGTDIVSQLPNEGRDVQNEPV
jgi:hypothetical protein